MPRSPGSERGAPRIRRRTALLGGAAAVSAATLATGCSRTGVQAASSVPEGAATGTPADGGVLRIARPPASQAETLDPADSLSAYEYLGALYNRLVRMDEGGEAVPDLATEWESDDEGTTWTFRLRDGVDFHDGTRFTSADAAYTLRRILDPDLASPQATVLTPLLSPEGVHTPGPGVLRVELDAPNFEFPALLSNYHCYLSCPRVLRRSRRRGIGSDPAPELVRPGVSWPWHAGAQHSGAGCGPWPARFRVQHHARPGPGAEPGSCGWRVPGPFLPPPDPGFFRVFLRAHRSWSYGCSYAASVPVSRATRGRAAQVDELSCKRPSLTSVHGQIPRSHASPATAGCEAEHSRPKKHQGIWCNRPRDRPEGRTQVNLHIKPRHGSPHDAEYEAAVMARTLQDVERGPGYGPGA